jgi:hypothetical protein
MENITIRDIQGKIIEIYPNKAISNDIILQTNLNKGIYFLNVLNLNTNENHIQKLIIHP